MAKRKTNASHSAMPRTKTPSAGRYSRTRRTLRPFSGRAGERRVLDEALAHGRDQLEEARQRPRLLAPRPGQVHVHHPLDAPGRGLSTTTRLDRNTASAMLWVTNSTVAPVSPQTLSSSRFSRSRVISSSAPNGSSIRRIDGLVTSARAMATRCCIPPESCHG